VKDMTVESFIAVLTALSTITSLVMEFVVKKFLDKKEKEYAANIVVTIVAAVVAGIGMPVYYLCFGVEWTVLNIVMIFLMMPANAIGAMLGYDKVVQSILQLKKLKG
jgi:hypothetical protein